MNVRREEEGEKGEGKKKKRNYIALKKLRAINVQRRDHEMKCSSWDLTVKSLRRLKFYILQSKIAERRNARERRRYWHLRFFLNRDTK